MTLEEAQAQLDHWLKINRELTIQQGSIQPADGGTARSTEYFDPNHVLKQINYWRRVVNRIQAQQSGCARGGLSVRTARFS